MKKTMLFGLALMMAVPAVRAADAEAVKGADTKKQADELVAVAKSCIDKAKMLAGDERKEAREKQYAAAVEAYAKALEICPSWQLLDDVPGDNLHKDQKWYYERVAAREKRGNLWKAMKQYDKAREEYEKCFEIPAKDMTNLRAFIQYTIAESYMEEQNWIAAEAAYQKSQKIGLVGWRLDLAPKKLEQLKPLAEKQRKEMAEKAAPKP